MSGANSATNRMRVLIVDDHPMTRAGLVHLINHEPDLVVCAEAENAADALGAVDACEPDLVLADITLPGKSGLELVKDIKAIRPRLPILVISMHDESLYAERALRAGASGYITKNESAENVLLAIRRVLAGEVYLSGTLTSAFLKSLTAGLKSTSQPLDRLTDRELEILELIGRGRATRQIAEALRLGVATVDTYRARIKEKMNFRSGTELQHFAIRWMRDRE